MGSSQSKQTIRKKRQQQPHKKFNENDKPCEPESDSDGESDSDSDDSIEIDQLIKQKREEKEAKEKAEKLKQLQEKIKDAISTHHFTAQQEKTSSIRLCCQYGNLHYLIKEGNEKYFFKDDWKLRTLKFLLSAFSHSINQMSDDDFMFAAEAFNDLEIIDIQTGRYKIDLASGSSPEALAEFEKCKEVIKDAVAAQTLKIRGNKVNEVKLHYTDDTGFHTLTAEDNHTMKWVYDSFTYAKAMLSVYSEDVREMSTRVFEKAVRTFECELIVNMESGVHLLKEEENASV